MDSKSISDILKYKNINGDPYLCDIQRWSGVGDFKVLKQFQSLFREIQDGHFSSWKETRLKNRDR